MLGPHEFFVGTLADAKPPTLVLPMGENRETFLIGSVEGETTAMFLNGSYSYHTMPCANTTNWQGVHVPSISLEVDPKSVLEPSRYDAPIGCLIRYGAKLAVSALADNGGFRGRTILLDVIDDLSAGTDDLRVAFLHWQVVLGTGNQRRVLFEHDLRQAEPTH